MAPRRGFRAQASAPGSVVSKCVGQASSGRDRTSSRDAARSRWRMPSFGTQVVNGRHIGPSCPLAMLGHAILGLHILSTIDAMPAAARSTQTRRCPSGTPCGTNRSNERSASHGRSRCWRSSWSPPMSHSMSVRASPSPSRRRRCPMRGSRRHAGPRRHTGRHQGLRCRRR